MTCHYKKQHKTTCGLTAIIDIVMA